MIDFLVKVDYSALDSFEIVKLLTIQRSMIKGMRWKLNEKQCFHLMENYKSTALCEGSSKQIRLMIGINLSLIVSLTNNEARSKIMAFIFDFPSDNNKYLEMLLSLLFNCLNSFDPSFIIEYLPNFASCLFDLLAHEDKDLQIMAGNVIGMISKTLLTSKDYDKVMSLFFIKDLVSWTTRKKLLNFFLIFYFNHFPILTEDKNLAVLSNILVAIHDEKVDVREAGALALTGFFTCNPKFIGKLLEENFKILRNKQESLLNRQSSALIVSAAILSSAYEVPEWLPQAAGNLAKHISDIPPIQKIVQRTFTEFKRTHLDNWHVDRLKFTEDQLEAISELLTSPSYYV